MDDYSSPAPTLEVPYDTLVGEEKTVDNVEMKKEIQKFPCTYLTIPFVLNRQKKTYWEDAQK